VPLPTEFLADGAEDFGIHLLERQVEGVFLDHLRSGRGGHGHPSSYGGCDCGRNITSHKALPRGTVRNPLSGLRQIVGPSIKALEENRAE
jgi:hypothetical protein